MNSKILLSIGISAVIIAVIATLLQENNTSLTEQEIRESIQNEISKSPKITGVHAQTVCEILDADCSDQTSFHAVYDPDDGYTKFGHTTPDGMWYEFRMIDDELEYKSDANPAEWMTFGDDSWMWEEDAKARGKTTHGDASSLHLQEYPKIYQFDSDELGNYERWCSAYNGIYSASEASSKVRCEIVSEKYLGESRDGLRKLQEKTISGELAQRMCAAYGKECQPGISITMEYDMETGYLLKDKMIDGQHFEFRIIEDDVIQYRVSQYPSVHWIPFEGN